MNKIDGKDVYSVSEVNYAARQTLEQIEIWVIGEIAQFRKNPSWRFYYLNLKDESAVLPCVADGSVFDSFKGDPNGQQILAYGYLTLYEPRGQYQLKTLKIEAVGEGMLQKQLEALIKKLKGEGLFDLEHKKELPVYPKRICVVTSHGSDAFNDFKKHTIGKFPIIELFVADVRVQGPQSTPQLVNLLPRIDKMEFDVLVITRGGGSLEDLAAFNDEQVARVIFSLKTPTVVAIGHEANESLAEWVADVRASTPTDAANVVVRGYDNVLEKLDFYRNRLSHLTGFYFSTNFQRLDHNYRQLTHMKFYFKDLPHKLLNLKSALEHSQKFLIADNSLLLENLYKSLTLLSPQNTLNRGYAITTDANGKIIKSVKNVVVGDNIGVKLKDGKLQTEVKSKSND